MQSLVSFMDTNIFTCHSTRTASTSKSKQVGLSLPKILKRRQLTNKTTFANFYSKPIVDNLVEILNWVALNILYYIYRDFME